MLISGALHNSRGAMFPALKSIGLSDAEARRAWTAVCGGGTVAHCGDRGSNLSLERRASTPFRYVGWDIYAPGHNEDRPHHTRRAGWIDAGH
jgi:hypothetical protein